MHKLFRAIPMTPLLIALLAFAAAACGGDGEPTAVPVDAAAAAEAANVEATAVADTTAGDAPALSEVATPVGDLGETPKDLPEDLKAIWEAWVLLNREYVDKDKLANPDEFTEGAIRGMTRVLEDSGTYYLPPRVASTMRQDIQGKFEGIGAHVNMNAAGKLLIVAPIEGSPRRGGRHTCGRHRPGGRRREYRGVVSPGGGGQDQGTAGHNCAAAGHAPRRDRPDRDFGSPRRHPADQRPACAATTGTASRTYGSPTSTPTRPSSSS